MKEEQTGPPSNVVVGVRNPGRHKLGRPTAAELAAFALSGAVIFLVLPVWLVRYPPLLDYPNHLASGFVLGHLHDPRFHFSELYRARWDTYPYVLLEGILVALQLVVPMSLAGRIVLTICLLAPPLAAWFFLRQANRTGEGLALWPLAFSYDYFFLNGFLAYVLGIAACFTALGLWLRNVDRLNVPRWIGLAAVFTLVYATHLTGFLVAGVIVTTVILVRRMPLLHLIATWLLFLPGALLFLHVSPTGAGSLGHFTYASVGQKVRWLWGVFQGDNSIRTNTITLVLLVASTVLARWRNPKFRWNTEWIIVAAVLLCLYAFLPSRSSGSAATPPTWDFDIRIIPPLFIVLLAMAQVGPRTRWLAAVATFVFVLRIWGTARIFATEQVSLGPLAASLDAIPAQARVLPASDRPQHFWAYGVIERGWLSPYLFTFVGQYPLRLRNGIYAPAGWEDIEHANAPDWERVRENYDYIWAFNVQRFAPQLRGIGELVYARGSLSNSYRIEVYRIRKRHPSKS